MFLEVRKKSKTYDTFLVNVGSVLISLVGQKMEMENKSEQIQTF